LELCYDLETPRRDVLCWRAGHENCCPAQNKKRIVLHFRSKDSF